MGGSASGTVGELLGRAPSGDLSLQQARERLTAGLFGRSKPIRVGRYRITEHLGDGGMGAVWGGVDDALGRRVAIKLIAQARASEPAARARFVREAQALAALSHPNVVTIFEVGEHEGAPFLAMEWVVGEALDDWLGHTPSWRRALAVLCQAGRGLAAAHAQGIVHRDFKPANVLVGIDGRVRVVDFGLARGQAEVWTPLSDAEKALATTGSGVGSLTRTGTVMGTPAYMPPEQFEGRAVGPAADQYAFCVAVYEALHGRRPFPETTARDLARARRKAPDRERPRREIPAYIHAAVLRGLEPDPAQRWPSMDDLLEVLAAGRGPRRWGIAAALAAIAVMGAAAVPVAQQANAEAECARASQGLASWWNAQRGGVRDAVLATGTSQAQQSWDRMEPAIDQYARAWAAASADACEANRVHGTTSDATLSAATACLTERRMALETLVEVIHELDADARAGLVRGVRTLPLLSACSDPLELKRRVDRQRDPGDEARARQVMRQLYRVDALDIGTRYDEALALARAMVDESDALGDGELRALARHWVGAIHMSMGAFAKAEPIISEAYFIAVEAGDEQGAAGMAATLTGLVGAALRRPEEAARWYRLGDVALQRRGGPEDDIDRGRLRTEYGAVLAISGQQQEALALLLPARDSLRRALGEADPIVARVTGSIAVAYAEMGRWDEALAEHRLGLELTGISLGTSHPQYGYRLYGISVVLGELDEAEAALDHGQRALAIFEDTLGEEHPDTAQMVAGVGVALGNLGRIEEGIAYLRRGVELEEKISGPESPRVAWRLRNMAIMLINQGRHADALQQLERAHAILEVALTPDDPRLGRTMADIGYALTKMGRLDEALAWTRRSVEHQDRTDPGETPGKARAVRLWANALLAAGRPAEAIALYRRALAIQTATTSSPLLLAHTRFGLARGLRESGGDPTEVQQLARAALATYEELGVKNGDEVRAFLGDAESDHSTPR